MSTLPKITYTITSSTSLKEFYKFYIEYQLADDVRYYIDYKGNTTTEVQTIVLYKSRKKSNLIHIEKRLEQRLVSKKSIERQINLFGEKDEYTLELDLLNEEIEEMNNYINSFSEEEKIFKKEGDERVMDYDTFALIIKKYFYKASEALINGFHINLLANLGSLYVRLQDKNPLRKRVNFGETHKLRLKGIADVNIYHQEENFPKLIWHKLYKNGIDNIENYLFSIAKGGIDDKKRNLPMLHRLIKTFKDNPSIKLSYVRQFNNH